MESQEAMAWARARETWERPADEVMAERQRARDLVRQAANEAALRALISGNRLHSGRAERAMEIAVLHARQALNEGPGLVDDPSIERRIAAAVFETERALVVLRTALDRWDGLRVLLKEKVA